MTNPGGARSPGSTWLHEVTKAGRKADVPVLSPGDHVRVWYRILERNRVRLTPFEGVVIRRRGAGFSATVTVRRVTHEEGVERVFPLHAPVLERIEVLRRAKTRRARLYFLRTKIGKARLGAADEGGPAKPSGEEHRTAAQRSEGRGSDAQRPEAHVSS